MTAKTTFTLRYLNRNSREVLAAAERLGRVEIRSRSGKRYFLSAEPPPAKMRMIPDFAARRRAAGMEMMTQEQSDALSQMIAGEPL